MSDQVVPAAPIPDSYWVIPGQLLAGEYPCHSDETRCCEKLQRILNAGVTWFIDLTEADEYRLRPYAPMLADLVTRSGVPARHTRFPIPDMGTPAQARMQEILQTIKSLCAAGETVYVHCYGGIGRTGTVIGCHLVQQGMTGATALAQIAQWRKNTPDGHRTSPETEAQRAMVLGWGAS